MALGAILAGGATSNMLLPVLVVVALHQMFCAPGNSTKNIGTSGRASSNDKARSNAIDVTYWTPIDCELVIINMAIAPICWL